MYFLLSDGESPRLVKNTEVKECIFRQQVIIQASFIKDDGTLFIIFNCNFSRFLVGGKGIAPYQKYF